MTEKERLVSPVLQKDEEEQSSFRPLLLDEFIGQSLVKENLKVFISSAKQRKKAMDHVLFNGSPDWERQRWPRLFQKSWGLAFGQPRPL